MMDVMSRKSTMEFLRRHVKTEMLLRHLMAVEAAMRGYARKFGEDEDRWGIAGLLHDFDWEICQTPEDHPLFGSQILREHGYPEDIIRAVLTHGNHTGLARESLMEHTLYAVDELSGFIRAVPSCVLPKAWKRLRQRRCDASCGTRISPKMLTGRILSAAPRN